LAVNTFVEAENNNEVINIVKLNQEIKEIVKKVDFLRESIDRIISEFDED